MSEKIKKSNISDILDLNAVQTGMLFHYLNAEVENQYNVQLAFDITGEFHVEIMQKAFDFVQSCLLLGLRVSVRGASPTKLRTWINAPSTQSIVGTVSAANFDRL